jgi:hypothetical protein
VKSEFARPTVHGSLAGGTREVQISDFHPVSAAQGLAAVVADSVDPGVLILPRVTFRAFPGHSPPPD